MVVEQGELMSGSPGATADGQRIVEVAIDAAGGGGARTYTYAVPPDLERLRDHAEEDAFGQGVERGEDG